MGKRQQPEMFSPEPLCRMQNRFCLSESLTLWLMILVSLFCFVHLWIYGQKRIGLDFYQFWAIGQMLRSDQIDNIYSDEARMKAGREIGMQALSDPTATRHRAVAKQRQVLESYSTPFLYTAISVFHSHRYEIAYQAYLIFCLLCSVLSILVLCRLLGYSRLAATAVIVLLTFCFEPFLADVRVANVNQIQLALLVLFMWVQSRQAWKYRDFAGGFVLGLMVMFKPNTIFVLALLMVFWLSKRLFRRFAWSMLGFISAATFAICLSSIFLGSHSCWIDWIQELKTLPDSIITVAMGNFALMRLLTDSLGSSISPTLPIFLFVLTAVFVWLSRSKGLSKREKVESKPCWLIEMQIVGLGCLLYLISAHLAWLHYYLLAVPMLLITLRASFSQTVSSWAGRFTHHTLTLTAVIMLIAVRWIISLFGAQQTSLVAFLLCAGVLLLFCLGLNDLWRMPRVES
jgi:hypothetical protein